MKCSSIFFCDISSAKRSSDSGVSSHVGIYYAFVSLALFMYCTCGVTFLFARIVSISEKSCPPLRRDNSQQRSLLLFTAKKLEHFQTMAAAAAAAAALDPSNSSKNTLKLENVSFRLSPLTNAPPLILLRYRPRKETT